MFIDSTSSIFIYFPVKLKFVDYFQVFIWIMLEIFYFYKYLSRVGWVINISLHSF